MFQKKVLFKGKNCHIYMQVKIRNFLKIAKKLNIGLGQNGGAVGKQ